MDAELLVGFGPDELAIVSRILAREDEAAATATEGGVYRKPTWHELWEAGWIEPPYCPLPACLLRELREAHRELTPRAWALFWPDADAVLLMLHEREPGLLRHKVTKRWGHMWRLTKAELNKGDQP